MADSDLVAIDTWIGLRELCLVTLQFLDDLLTVVTLDNHIYRLNSRGCASYDTGGRAIGGRTRRRRAGNHRRGRLRIVDDLTDYKLIQVHVWIGLLQVVEATPKLICDTIAIITLLAGVLPHSNGRRCGAERARGRD